MKKKLLKKLNGNTQKLIESSEMSADEFVKLHPITGNREEDISDIRSEYGANKISFHKRKGVFRRLLDSFLDPFSLVLIALGVVTLVMDLVEDGKFDDYVSLIIIFSMVLIAGGLQFFQEAKSGQAFEKLTEMVETTTLVERNVGKDENNSDTRVSERTEIPLDEVVIYDVIHLRAGDIIPADMRLVFSKDLFVSQSSLTGESEPIEKHADLKNRDFKTTTDRENLLFMGTTVESGYGIGVVIATGDNTFFGQIASKLNQKREPTSFEKGIKKISLLLIRITLVVVPIVLAILIGKGYLSFAYNTALKDMPASAQADIWMQGVLFAISIAVGLTPEMLPTIVVASLSKGALTMSKKKVIIKKLNSIQNFGGMDVLCTDKTGTLTQDKVIVERHLDVNGRSSIRVLRHAYLNSYFQTGLKNLLDLSIIEKKDELWQKNKELQGLEERYKKVDEIPFDFKRRRLSIVLEDKTGKTQMITKGAIEEILGICTFVEYDGEVVPLDEKMKRLALEKSDQYNAEGFRVIGVAQKTSPRGVGAFSVQDENDMVLLGFLTFFDPPKESAKEAIEAIREYGVTVKILTGDNEKTTAAICKMVGVSVNKILLGSDIANMSEEELIREAKDTDVFAKVSPSDKARVVRALKNGGHVVGFMGDGINDAPALRAADVSVSVDTAADIAKESADIILLEKDLNVLKNGIIEGRRTFGNMMKYINLTVSSNFGNIFSIILASIFLPFLPMLPIQLLLLNLIYDLICVSLPWDNISEDYLKTPKTIDTKSIVKFMLLFGPISSLFDLTTFAIMFFIICPQVAGLPIGSVNPFNYQASVGTYAEQFEATFRAGWFIESIWTQLVVLYFLRTRNLFKDKKPSLPLFITTGGGVIFASLIPFIPGFNQAVQFAPSDSAMYVAPLNPWYILVLLVTLVAYATLLMLMKKAFYYQGKPKNQKLGF